MRAILISNHPNINCVECNLH